MDVVISGINILKNDWADFALIFTKRFELSGAGS